mgnify:CR=1 FL=1
MLWCGVRLTPAVRNFEWSTLLTCTQAHCIQPTPAPFLCSNLIHIQHHGNIHIYHSVSPSNYAPTQSHLGFAGAQAHPIIPKIQVHTTKAPIIIAITTAIIDAYPMRS